MRYVAFTDVLGFGSIVRNNAHEYLVQLYQGALRLVAEYASAGGRMRTSHDDPGRREPDVDLATVNMRLISDSVILWTDGDRPSELVALLQTVRIALFVGIATGIPMRTAIAWGPTTHERREYGNSRLFVDTIVGSALVDAYDAEQRQEWSGGVLLPSAAKRYEQTRLGTHGAPGLQDLRDAGWIARYEVPFRDDPRPEDAVNWPRAVNENLAAGGLTRGRLTRGLLHQAFAEHGKSVDSDRVQQKIDNTVAFARHLGELDDDRD